MLSRILQRSWTPVGGGHKHPTEFAHVLAYLGDGPDGQQAIDRVNARFSALPGMASLRIYRRAATLKHEIRASSRSAASTEH